MRALIATALAALSVALASCRCDVAADQPPVELTRARFPELFSAGPAATGGVRDAAGARRLGSARFERHGDRVEVTSEVSLEGLLPPLVVDPGWASAGALGTGRQFHTATLLPQGTVLVAGGDTGPAVTNKYEL